MAASYISVPRDLTKVKSKVMFNLTKRQLICFGMAVLIGVPSFFLMKTVMKTNTAVMGMMVIMMPFFFLARCAEWLRAVQNCAMMEAKFTGGMMNA